MKYLFDTDTLSELMRRAPSIAFLRRLAMVRPELQSTSAITLGELLYGAERVASRGSWLRERIEEVVTANLPVLPFDERAAQVYGSLRSKLEAAGTPIGDANMRIASIALSRDLVVVTGNMRHFARVEGLQVENWLSG